MKKLPILAASILLCVSNIASAQTFSAKGMQNVDSASGHSLALDIEKLERTINTVIAGTIPNLDERVNDRIDANVTEIERVDTNLATIESRLEKIETEISSFYSKIEELQKQTVRIEALETQIAKEPPQPFIPKVNIRTRTVDGDAFARGITLNCNDNEVVTGCHNHCSNGGDDTYAYPTGIRTCQGAEGDNNKHKGTCTLVAACMEVE